MMHLHDILRMLACYWHACVKQVQEDQLTNNSLRVRFGLPESSAGVVSRLIKDAVEKKLRFYSHLSGNGEMGLGLRDRVSRLRGRSSRSIPRRCGSPLPSV